MRGTDDTHHVAQLAAWQFGNVDYRQLRSAGLSDGDIERRVEMGWLVRRHTRVFAVGHVPTQRESRWMAALLALGDEAALGYRTAGAHWHLVRGAVPTEVIVPGYAGRPNRDGILVHREILPSEHVEEQGPLRVTTVLRTVLNLAAVLQPVPLGWAFEEAQVIHKLAPELVAAEVIARRGYRGNGRLRDLLREAVDPAAVRSVLELRFLKLCADHDIPRPLVNEPIGIWTPDFWWPVQGVIVETDGYDFHRTAAKRRRDAEKDEFLRSLGFVVIRLSWADVTERPLATAERIRRALER